MASFAGAEPIQTPKIALVIANRLRRQIISGELRPGDTLPPEAQMLAQLGISRPALREALRILEAESLITVARGIRGGATVMEPDVEKAAQYGTFFLVSNGTTPREIHEARALLEPVLAEQLAAKGSKAVVNRLRQCVEGGLAQLEQGNLRHALLASNSFHELLVQFAENRAFVLLVGILHEIAVANYLSLEEGADEATRIRLIRKAFEEQLKLVSLIENKDAVGARVLWQDYMARTSRILAKTKSAGETIKLSPA